MKKFLVPLTLLGTLFVAGCLGGEESSVDSSTDGSFVYTTVQGELLSLGSVKFNPKATHLFRTDEGEVIYVYSDEYNLFDEQYRDQYLEIGGLLYPETDEVDKATMEIDTLVFAAEKVDAIVAFSMERYVHEPLGFAMDYRSDWSVDAIDTQATFTAPAGEVDGVGLDLIHVSSRSNVQELDIEEWYLQYVVAEGTDTLYSPSVVSPDSLPAIKVISEDSTTYYIADDQTVFVVTHGFFETEHQQEYANLFTEMIQSFDALSDGQRESEGNDANESSDTGVETAPLDALSGTDFDSVIRAVNADLNNLIDRPGDWTATQYEFADPDYVYVDYRDADSDELGRMLLRIHDNDSFEVLAVFEEGDVTDWELVSGNDEATDSERTQVSADSGTVTTIPEGYRSFESASLEFQMQYPSSWYYARLESAYFFSDQPAEESNALVTLMIVDSPVSGTSEQTLGGSTVVSVPRDEGSSYRLEGSSEFSDILSTMGQSITSTAS